MRRGEIPTVGIPTIVTIVVSIYKLNSFNIISVGMIPFQTLKYMVLPSLSLLATLEIGNMVVESASETPEANVVPVPSTSWVAHFICCSVAAVLYLNLKVCINLMCMPVILAQMWQHYMVPASGEGSRKALGNVARMEFTASEVTSISEFVKKHKSILEVCLRRYVDTIWWCLLPVNHLRGYLKEKHETLRKCISYDIQENDTVVFLLFRFIEILLESESMEDMVGLEKPLQPTLLMEDATKLALQITGKHTKPITPPDSTLGNRNHLRNLAFPRPRSSSPVQAPPLRITLGMPDSQTNDLSLDKPEKRRRRFRMLHRK